MNGYATVTEVNRRDQHIDGRAADDLGILIDPTHIRIFTCIAIHIERRVPDLFGYVESSFHEEMQAEPIHADDRVRSIAVKPPIKLRLSWMIKDQWRRQPLGTPLISIT